MYEGPAEREGRSTSDGLSYCPFLHGFFPGVPGRSAFVQKQMSQSFCCSYVFNHWFWWC